MYTLYIIATIIQLYLLYKANWNYKDLYLDKDADISPLGVLFTIQCIATIVYIGFYLP